MTATESSCPLPRAQVADRYFLEHRAKLLDLAAFLDRLDRAPIEPIPGAADGPIGEDVRIAALRAAIPMLTDGHPNRTKRILEHLSDPTTDPVPAATTQPAAGAPIPNP